MFLEEFDPFAAEVGGLAGSVAAVRDHEEGEVLVGLNKVVHDLVGGGRVDVFVHFADGEHEVAFELGDVGAVGVFDVGIVNGPIEPLLVPPHFVDAVVVATAVGDGGFVEITVVEEGCGRGLSTCGATVNSDASEVHFGVFGSGGFHPLDAIGEAGVLEVFVGNLVKVTAAIIGPKAVDLNYNEAPFGHFGFVTGPTGPAFGDEGTVGAGVDVFDDGVFFVFIEVAGSPNDSVDVVFVVAIFGDEALGFLPSGGKERG